MDEQELLYIINSVNSSWSKDYVIRYLYVKLAPYFRRDIKYFLASEEDKYKQFSQGFINRGRDVVCSTLSDYYVELFQTFGIRAKKIIANDKDIPLFAVIVEGDHGWFFMDILQDLFNNQYGLMTTDFGVIPHYDTLINNYPFLEQLPNEYICKIDDDLNIPEKLNDYYNNLHLVMTNRHKCREFLSLESDTCLERFTKKMEFSNQQLINLGNVNGPIERIRVYWLIERMLFFKAEKRNLKMWLSRDYEFPRVHIEYTDFGTNEKILYQEIEKDKQYELKRIY